MIALTRLNNAHVILNSDLIETIETTPDTVIRLTNGQQLVVRESCEEIIDRVLGFRGSLDRTPYLIADPGGHSCAHRGLGDSR